MFQDGRSKKIVLVAHCVLNQNSKIDACAHYPGVILEATKALLDGEAGIIQLPCPELLCLGLDREADIEAIRTVESEDTRVANLMKNENVKCLCQSMVDNVVYQVEEYRKHGFQIIGLLGINGSPTCGVDTTWSDDREYVGQGVFIELLEKAFRDKGIFINMIGIKARDPKQAVVAVEKLNIIF
ncbi:Hypothetical protein LUCI_2378 [Lucifera butyrica]|uniref:Uncharacterized protein n=1 Tax=Lucifera butyrica TaxID=1351585 RepID=A0A498R6L3_9FIRM|nr:CD3072 family TudS-related putative desulfidase [Lucifera butyrica]VBB07134.1 Hypothetical protein LUCI_2378 [Lucifera butyrica]